MRNEDDSSEPSALLERLTSTVIDCLATCKRAGSRIADSLTGEGEIESLSIPETQTTTIRGDTGWANRPPAVLECPRCGGEFDQHRAVDLIDCPYCVAEFSPEAVRDLEVVAMRCPRCHTDLDYGKRHPNVFEVPQWAHCEHCQYHWEFTHSF
ncbi:hypothetical protein [Natrinema sp. 1APR25-10V2]|uniref:hypothetical protein n=1 Tax=Natrinema sp. 1APR25-10V2 TaxID=2951081 RepID=UPI00287437DA|nr:hypothetical protein [Natrinema sp. 1APR25-10V2]MDS0476191.1 hypothetical protein [Natrinema sp. 1APR25-10V2]